MILKKTITDFRLNQFQHLSKSQTADLALLKFFHLVVELNKNKQMESLTDEYDFSHDFLKPKMQQKTKTPPPPPHPEVLAKKLPLACSLEQSPQTTPLTLPPEPFHSCFIS